MAPSKTIVYVRSNPADPADTRGYQEDVCRQFAARRGWEVDEVLSDSASGLQNDRAGYLELLGAIASGVVARVIVTGSHVLTRDYAEARRLANLAEVEGTKLYGALEDLSLMGASLADTDAAMVRRVAVPHVDEPGDERTEVWVMLLFGDDAELVFGNRTTENPLRVPAVDIIRDTGVPLDQLPGKRFSAVVTEDPEHGQRVTGFRPL